MKLLQIPPDASIVDKVWPAVIPFLSKAVEYSRGTHSVERSRERIKENSAQLWVIIEDTKPHTVVAAGLTSITEYPNGKKALMLELLGGKDMKAWFDLKSDIEAWAAKNGCTLSFAWARKGWAKHLPDYKLSHYLLAKEIN
jgi:hypothetical protein